MRKVVKAAVTMLLLSSLAFAGIPRPGMSVDELLKLKGPPQSRAVVGNRAIYEWPDLRVKLVDGKVTSIDRLVFEASEPVGDQEISLLSILSAYHDKLLRSITRDEFEILNDEMSASFRAVEGKLRNVPFRDEARRYLNANIAVSIVWRSVQTDMLGNTYMLVDRNKDPEAFRLIGALPIESRRKISLVAARFYRVDDISPVLAFVQSFYWEQLLDVFDKNRGNVVTPSAGEVSNLDPRAQDRRSLSKRIELAANVQWNDSGTKVKKGVRYRVQYLEGSWRPNSGWEPVRAEGNSHYVASGNYLLPGKPEGALVGKIGEGAVFYIGNSGVTPDGEEGELLLGTNDDPHGLGDNTGSIEVTIEPLDQR